MIYTTNPIEGYHRQIRKVTKTKGAFPNETALLKLVYLVTKNVENKWTTPITDWGLIVQQLAIRFFLSTVAIPNFAIKIERKILYFYNANS